MSDKSPILGHKVSDEESFKELGDPKTWEVHTQKVKEAYYKKPIIKEKKRVL